MEQVPLLPGAGSGSSSAAHGLDGRSPSDEIASNDMADVRGPPCADGGTAVTMEAMAALLEQTLSTKIDPLQRAIDTVGADLNAFKDHIEQEIGILKIHGKGMEKSFDEMKVKIQQVEADILKIKLEPDEVLSQKIRDIEQAVQNLRLRPERFGNLIAVIGGLSDVSSPALAKDWVKEQLDKASITGFTDLFSQRRRWRVQRSRLRQVRWR